MILVPFEIEHVSKLLNYGGQEGLVKTANIEDIEELKNKGEAYTAINSDRIICCAGVVRVTDYKGIAWGLYQRGTKEEFKAIFLKTRAFLARQNYKRIEAYVDPTVPSAARWVKLLGFKIEIGYLPYFFPNGSGASLWVK